MSSSATEAKGKAVLRILQGCDSHRKLQRVHGVVVTGGLQLRFPAVWSALLRFSAVSSAGRLSYAERLFQHLLRQPSSDDFNSLIRGFSQSPSPQNALFYYNHMLMSSRPDTYTFSFVLRASQKARSPEKCREVHGSLVRLGFESDVVVGTNLLRSYAGHGMVDDAGKVFDEMPVRDRDLVAWNAVLSCYSRASLHAEALEVYRRMRLAGVTPDAFTLVAVLSSSARVGALAAGLDAHRTARERGLLRTSVFVGNALIDMYAKCGCLDSALAVFESMRRRDVLTWNSMIVGYAVHGRGGDAVEFFEKMVSSGETPNAITFLGLLSGCSHQGLVEKGLELFDLMTSKFNIKPGVKHYGCLVDLYGRAGKLKRALSVVEARGSDPVLWRTLLGSCKIHGNAEIGETAMRNLVRLGCASAGDHVLLAAIYKAEKDSDGVARMRKTMKSRGIKTSPGYSWIEVADRVHRFCVDDESHAESGEIYDKLEEVARELGSEGRV